FFPFSFLLSTPCLPYSTLFRSGRRRRYRPDPPAGRQAARSTGPRTDDGPRSVTETSCRLARRVRSSRVRPREPATEESISEDGRSEEHTSELQSRENLVCRLLL